MTSPPIPPDLDNEPSAYFAPLNSNGPLGNYFSTHNQHFWMAIHRVLPMPDDDVDLAFAQLVRYFGIERHRAEKLYYGVANMAKLPELSRLHEDSWFLDEQRLIVIGNQLVGVDDAAVLRLIDDALVHLFTPTAKNQELPGTRRMYATIRDILRQFFDLTEEDKDKDDDRYRLTPRGQTAHVGVSLDAVDAEAIDAHVRKYAAANKCTLAHALRDLVLNGASTTVVINVFKSEGDSLAYLPGHGFIDPERAGLPVSTRDLEPGRTEGYTPTAAQRAFVEARDGTCRRAGCTVLAKHCQLDHRIEFDEGGETSTDNLVAVCQHHHNVKTDRRADYLLDPDTGHAYWLFEDGTWESTEPQGIMAQRWKQTIAQRTAQLAAERNLTELPAPEEVSFDD